MTCANCGTPQKDNEEICLACGAKYPEINNDKQPTSKKKTKEVGSSSGIYNVFDSKNDAMNMDEHEENIFYDVLKNKKTKKETTKKETTTNKNSNEKKVVQEPVQEVVQEPVQEEVQEPVQEAEQEVEQNTTLDSIISENVVDTENNVFKDSTEFDISLSDLEELEKSISKASEEIKEESQVVTFDEYDILNMTEENEIFEGFEDISDLDEKSEETEETLELDNDVLSGVDLDFDFDSILETLSNAQSENAQENIAENIQEINLEEISVDEINLAEIESLFENIPEEILEMNEIDEIIDDSNKFKNDIDTTTTVNQEERSVETPIETPIESPVETPTETSFEQYVEEANKENNTEINTEANTEVNEQTDELAETLVAETVNKEVGVLEDSDKADDFIKLDGIDDIINDLDIEDIEDIDAFLAENKAGTDLELEEVVFNDEDVSVEPTLNESEDKEHSVFDLSFDELDNLEKMLIAEKESSPISDIEAALLNGEDLIHNKPSEKEQLIEDVFTTEQSTEAEPDETVINTTKSSGLNISNHDFTKISEEKFNKVDKALRLKEKGETADYIKENKKDFDINIDTINEILSNIKDIKIELDSYNDEYDEDVLSLEESLLEDEENFKKHEKLEKAVHVDDIDNITDIDFADFVSEDEIDDDDNIVKADKDENTQSAVDEIIQKAKDEAESQDVESNSVEETVNAEDVVNNETTEEVVEEVINKEASDVSDTKPTGEISDFENEILSKITTNEDAGIQEAEEAVTDDDLDSLLLDVIGTLDVAKPKQQLVKEELEKEKEKEAFQPEVEEVQEFIGNLGAVQGLKYDEELVREYETLRMDLEMFFPNSQELEKLEKDISLLLASNEVEELATQMEHDILLGDLGDYDFEELNDKEISDALLEIREMKEKEDNAKLRRNERQKKIKRGQKMFGKFYTYGGIFKKVDATIVHFTLITLVIVGFAVASTYEANSLTVNMQSRSEKLDISEQLWNGLYDNANQFKLLQTQMQEYVDGEVDQEEIIIELNTYINENIEARKKFETVDMPTYSEYKYKIDKFLSDRMLVAEAALRDVNEGKRDSENIQKLIRMQTDIESFEKAKEDFYKQMGIAF